MSLLPPFDPLLAPPSFFDPYYSYGFDPYSYGNTRRRMEGGEAPTGQQVASGAEAGGGRRPFTVGSAGWTRSIPCDFIEREKEYVVRADIPGCKKSEVHVEVHDGNVLRFGHNPRAEREREDEEEPGIFHRAERVSTFRNRNLRMPDDADLQSDSIKAAYEDGVLTITIPKKEGMRPEGKLVPIA